MSKKLIQLYEASSKEGLNWYKEANSFCRGLSSRYSVSVETVAGVLAALSPASNWERNKQETDWLLATIAGKKVTPFKFVTYGKNVAKATLIAKGVLDPYSAFSEKTGPKTFNFFWCIVNPDSPDYVCIDRHAYTIATGKVYTGLKTAPYRKIAEMYRKAAKKLAILPSQLQAVLWVYKVTDKTPF